MSLLKWDGKDSTRMNTLDEKALKDGGLGDAVANMAQGDSPQAAILKAVTKGVTMETKGLQTSKLNWLAVATTAFGAYLVPMFNDPALQPILEQVKSMIPPTWIPYITMVGGITTFVLRTFFTSQAVAMPGSNKPLATPPSGG